MCENGIIILSFECNQQFLFCLHGFSVKFLLVILLLLQLSNVAPTTTPTRITTGSTAVTSINFATSTTAAEPTPTPSIGDVATGKLMHTTCYVCL